MYAYLFLVCLLYVFGTIFFGHFEIHTPKRRKVAKVLFTLGLVALVVNYAGGGWALALVLFMFALGLGFHFVWCYRNGIHPLTAEPHEKYYALRGWKLN